MNTYYNKYKDMTIEEIELSNGKGTPSLLITDAGSTLQKSPFWKFWEEDKWIPNANNRHESDGTIRIISGRGIITTNDWFTPSEIIKLQMRSPLSHDETRLLNEWEEAETKLRRKVIEKVIKNKEV